MKNIPRFMVAAAASGSGKTTLTCGLMRLLQRQGYTVQGFKCGPDYIDPMFHTKVLGLPSVNLDSFFAQEDMLRYLFAHRMDGLEGRGLAVIEGVMGFYDGLAGRSTQGSSYDIARIADIPVILCIDAKGMSLSVVPFIKGFLEYTADSHIKGVILNRCSKGMFPILKELIEAELPVRVLGYLPVMEDCELPSRHLGLYLPQEITDFREKLERLADTLQETIDIDALLALAASAPQLKEGSIGFCAPDMPQKPLRVAIARDDAFCFYYQDNLELLEQYGVELVPFSPMQDEALPEHICGLLLGGGYPEIFAGELCCNLSMRRCVKQSIEQGIPCLAECGGFLYLHESITDLDGFERSMVGIIPAKASYQGKLQPHFGYITLTDKPSGMTIRGHEFHYYDSTDHGEAWTAAKPLSSRHWTCMHKKGSLLAGFPHLYYASNPEFIAAWVRSCAQWGERKL